MRVRFLAPLLLLALLAAASFAPVQISKAGAQQPASGQVPGQVDVVKAAYDNLMDLYYKPLTPSVLLNAGWQGLTRTAASAGLPTPQPL
ncbi:MAG TPA: hypothetical protein VK821_12885, partial [Dehalococcoidia bacterium]|nr:hypothetical protein [Dehalococcoidia bacterium]